MSFHVRRKFVFPIVLFLLASSLFWIDPLYQLYFRGTRLGLFRGSQTPEELVAEYLNALHRSDVSKITRLTPAFRDSSRAIDEKLSRLKMVDISNAQVNYIQEGIEMRVEISSLQLPDNALQSDEIWLAQDCTFFPGIVPCKKWFLQTGNVWDSSTPALP